MRSHLRLLYIILCALVSSLSISLLAVPTRSQQACRASRIHSIAFSPDGKYLVSGWDDYSARMWNVQTGEVIHTFVHKDSNSPNSISFSADGKYVLLGEGLQATLWDSETGRMLHTYPRTHHNLYDLQAMFVPNSQNILTSTREGATLWKISGEKLHDFYENAEASQWASVSSDGKYALIPGGYWELWDLTTLQKQQTFESAPLAGFSPDGKTILTNGGLGLVLHSIETGKPVRTFVNGFRDDTWSFSSNGKYLATSDYSAGYSILLVWDVHTGQILSSFAFHDGYGLIDFLPDNENYIVVYRDKKPDMPDQRSLHVWSIKEHKETNQTILDSFVSVEAFSPDGKSWVADDGDGILELRDSRTWRKIRRFC